MNPSDNQQNYWQNQPEPQPVEQPLVPETQPAATPPSTDYPTETYQPEQSAEESAPPQEAQPPAAPEVDEPPVSWVAKEYVELQKGTGWYIIFAVVVALLIAADIFLLRSYTFSVLVVVMTIALVVYIRRPARDIQYTLSARQGLYIGDRLYHLSDFRAFGLIKDGNHHSIMLIPVKRFASGVSVYFPEEAGEQIVDILGQRLPMETLKLDMIDVIVRKLRL